ncbi:hypothetical protein GC170_09935 [bacterium]|nr:hypothetical protein [bacterium]
MGAKTAQIDQLFWRIVEIRKKVAMVNDMAHAAADPLETYFRAQGSLARNADDDLKKVLKVTLEAKEFANSFAAKGIGKWKDASWLIENLTQGSAGAKEKNQQGITILGDLKTKVDAAKDVTVVADGLADAILALLHIDIKNVAQSLTSMSAVNPMVWKDIKKINTATRSRLNAFSPNIDEAISLLQRM